jgi:translocation and assembly module TamB
MMELTLNSRIFLTGTPEKSSLAGEVMLLEGRYYKDVALDLVNTATRRVRKVSPVKEKKSIPFLENMALNVQVNRREPLLVDNNMAYLLISPDLTLRGTAHTPLITGRTTVDSGTINFNKTEFEVKKGVIDFANPYKIEPTIDIEGETVIRTWTVTLMVSGTPDNLNLELYSDPFETHADIISLIAFGKTSREMGKTQDGGEIASGQIVSNMLANAFQKDLKAASGLDQLEFRMGSGTGSGAQGVQVTMGKDLSRQMGVTYGVDTRGGETVQQVSTYYKLLENLLVKGFQDSGGKMGGEIKYRLEFR